LVRRSQYSLAGTFHWRRFGLLKIGFFREVRELKKYKGKIQAVLYRLGRVLAQGHISIAREKIDG
jgi:hypothetical protein